jgi:N-acetylglucosamine-6-phosphate deacetylase
LCETGERASVTLDKGRITVVEPEPPHGKGDFPSPQEEIWISPGWIDLQLNGYGGYDFNRGFWTDGETPEETVARVVELAARAGTAALCPTICTNGFEAMRAGIAAVTRARESDPSLAAAIPAIHMEGPYLSHEDGPRGAHPLEHVRDPDWDEFRRFQEVAGGRIRLLTLAPERGGSLPFIEKVVGSGVTVAIGHTAATPEVIRDAVKAGARLSTHLGNGAHARIARHPNYIWEQLAHDDLIASVIADGHHLPPAVLKCFARVKGPDRLILVSDAVALGGLPPGLYNAGRHEVLPTGKVVLAGTPYLAGAGHLMDTCAANALRFTDLGMSGVARAASTNPARLLGLGDRKGRVAPGYDADLTLFRQNEGDGPMEIIATVRAGKAVYERGGSVWITA